MAQHTVRAPSSFIRGLMPSQTDVVTLIALLVALTVQIPGSLANGSGNSDLQQHVQSNPQHLATEWPSLRFNYTFKRGSMKVHGQSAFSMVAEPIVSAVGSHVVYNAIATFQQDTMVHSHTFVDGAAYYVTSNVDNTMVPLVVKCLDPGLGHLPPINAIAKALNEAWQLVPGLCASGLSGLKMYGSDMDITVEYFDERMNISAPQHVPKCAAVMTQFQLTPTGNALLKGLRTSPGDTRRLKAEFDFSWGDSSSSHRVTNQPRFIELLGQYDWPRPVLHVDGVRGPQYREQLMDNNTPQQQICDRTLAVSKTSTKSKIVDTIVVTHSMG
ncbi:hypothetical protein ON010_g12029 [Phytophthora cinnamomi]|nr:hypothetical protein ON010_g12029 [Phytophthora cinnamomi]